MISTTIRNSPNAPPRKEDTPPPRNRSKNPQQDAPRSARNTPSRLADRPHQSGHPLNKKELRSHAHCNALFQPRTSTFFAPMKERRRVCEVRNFAYFCNSNTQKKEHQSRLSVAKLVAKNFRTAIFLRGNRLKINNKILSLRKAHLEKWRKTL